MQVSSSARYTAPCTPFDRQTCRCLRTEPQHSYDSHLDPHCYSQQSRRPSPSAFARCRKSGRLCNPLIPTRTCCWSAACDWQSRSPTWRRQSLPSPANVPLNPSLTLRDPPSQRGFCRLTVSDDPTPGCPSAPTSGSRLIVAHLTFFPPQKKELFFFFFQIAESVQFFPPQEKHTARKQRVTLSPEQDPKTSVRRLMPCIRRAGDGNGGGVVAKPEAVSADHQNKVHRNWSRSVSFVRSERNSRQTFSVPNMAIERCTWD